MTDELTQIENDSIREFVHFAADGGYLRGRVLDYGCGRQPYRRIVKEHGGEYIGFDRASFPCNRAGDVGGFAFDPLEEDWDAILCTQILQFVPFFFRDDDGEGLPVLLRSFWHALRGGGHLVMTYTTNWPEVNEEDLHRFTKAGMERLLTEAGFIIIEHVRRATFHQHSYEWAFGYGVVARA